MKNGFTLMELLVVIVIVSVISVSSVLAFGNIDDSTAIKDRINMYKDIQRSAVLYIDLNNSWLNQFRERGYMYVDINELMNSNYVEIEKEDPVTGEPLPSSYLVKIYTAYDGEGTNGNQYIDTCILDKTEINSVYCNTEIRKCCNQEDKYLGKDNCKRQEYVGGTYVEVTIDGDEEEKCLDKPQNCSCYSPKLCKKKTCVANSKGEPFDCCAKELN